MRSLSLYGALLRLAFANFDGDYVLSGGGTRTRRPITSIQRTVRTRGLLPRANGPGDEEVQEGLSLR
jgi:hypothetical protein